METSCPLPHHHQLLLPEGDSGNKHTTGPEAQLLSLRGCCPIRNTREKSDRSRESRRGSCTEAWNRLGVGDSWVHALVGNCGWELGRVV